MTPNITAVRQENVWTVSIDADGPIRAARLTRVSRLPNMPRMSPSSQTREASGPSDPGRSAIAGHLWTVGALVSRWLRPPPAAPSEPFRATVDDPVSGSQPVSGLLHRPVGARRLAVFVHGLGGSPSSTYMSLLAGIAHRLGLASLRLSLRGSRPSRPPQWCPAQVS